MGRQILEGTFIFMFQGLNYTLLQIIVKTRTDYPTYATPRVLQLLWKNLGCATVRDRILV